jgi:hypothetical protein
VDGASSQIGNQWVGGILFTFHFMLTFDRQTGALTLDERFRYAQLTSRRQPGWQVLPAPSFHL